MSAVPPVFGPTEIVGDDQADNLAIVQIALPLSREQLRTALAIGHAQMGGEPPLADMDVLDVRREIEGYLGAASVIDLHREASVVAERITPEHAAELDAAIDRAYTRRPAAPRTPQDPRYSQGSVTLQTLDQGEVTVPEPAWCVGHDDELVGYLADLTHNGPSTTAGAVTARYGRIPVLEANITHAPHADKQREQAPLLSIRVDVDANVAPEDARHIAQALRVAAVRLDRAITGLDHLRGEQR
ncbi:hypothetical protein OIE75_20360 [Streptomyces sp. NBC_01723]|uniref:DUF6907 domain-containing protein n=1 Tax=Streptomyces sp. NBC_01723 TaxID=2975921 RepID=UPI002E36CCA4|nr:hypothetical protein [Streptomyces sp. NBC_01723]